MGIYRYYNFIRMCLVDSAKNQKLEPSAMRATFRPPPGLSLFQDIELPPGLSPIPSSTSAGSSTLLSEYDGPNRCEELDSKHLGIELARAAHAEWRIDTIWEKLRLSGGKLVSSHYLVGGMSKVRFIFDAGAVWAAEGRNRRGKGRAASTSERSVCGSILLKVEDQGPTSPLKFILRVGSNSQGPYEFDFNEKNVHECPLTSSWVDDVDVDSGNLVVRLDFL
jgi:hypothetical protein